MIWRVERGKADPTASLPVAYVESGHPHDDIVGGASSWDLPVPVLYILLISSIFNG